MKFIFYVNEEMEKTKKRNRRKPGARSYADYSIEMLKVGVDLVQNKVISPYEAEKQFGIPRRTIVNKSKNIHNKPFGRPTELSSGEETHIANVVNLSAEFGCPLSLIDLRIVVYNYLIKVGKAYLFKGNMPGECWARAFLQRHNFSQRATQNIKRSRAAKNVEEMQEYYKNLETSLKNVSASNILNFDETKLSDDPENDTEPIKNPNQLKNKKPKITVISNIVIKDASSKKNVLRDKNKRTNKRKSILTEAKKQTSNIKKKKNHYNSESSLTSDTSFHAADDSDYENFDNYITSCLIEQEEQEDLGQENVYPLLELSDIDYKEDSLYFQENMWVIVKFSSKKSVKHFIGKVLSIKDKIPLVKFARKVKNSKRDKGIVFTYPIVEDVCAVQDLKDVIAVLPDPQISRRGHYIFNLDLDKYNIQ